MTVELNDTALMLRYRDGDMAAFESLYERHRGPLFRFFLRQTGSRPLAEDLFQETWGRVVKARRSYRPSAKFSTYLYRIARNCLIDQQRRMGTQARVIEETTDATPEPIAQTGDPEAAAATADTRASLLHVLSQLPDAQREVFLLRAEAGFTLAEIAQLTDSSTETVKSRLRYALNKLRTGVLATEIEIPQDFCDQQS